LQVRLAALLPLVLHYLSHILLLHKVGAAPPVLVLLFYCCVVAVAYCSWAACNVSSRRLFLRHAVDTGLVASRSSGSSEGKGGGGEQAQVVTAAGGVQHVQELKCD
jgi:hypothetical protein